MGDLKLRLNRRMIWSFLIGGMVIFSVKFYHNAWSDDERVGERSKPLLSYAPRQSDRFEFDDLLLTGEPDLIEEFLNNHPQFDLNEPVEIAGLKSSAFDNFVNILRLKMVNQKEFEDELALVHTPEETEKLNGSLSRATENLGKYEEILKKLLEKGANPRLLNLRTQPWWAQKKDMSEVNSELEGVLGAQLFRQKADSSARKSVGKSSTKTLNPALEEDPDCRLSDFAPGVREAYEKILDLQKIKKKKLGQMTHLYVSTDAPGCQLSWVIQQRLRGGEVGDFRIESARLYNKNGVKELTDQDFKNLIQQNDRAVSQSGSAE